MKIKKTFQGTIPENKILNSNSTSQTDTYSCDYINKLDVNLIQGEIENGVVLWENPSPTSEFSEQTITLSSDDYDYLEVYCNANEDTLCYKIPKGRSIMLNYLNQWATGTGFSNRYFNYVDDTHYQITDNYYRPFSAAIEIRNSAGIPIKVIGYKNTIPAVVVKEKTEEIYSTEETVIGKWIDGKPLYRKVFISECPGNTDISIQHGINGIFVVNANGIGVYNNSIFFPIPYAVAGSNTQSSYAITQETINVSSKAGDLRTFYITLEYTKTTD